MKTIKQFSISVALLFLLYLGAHSAALAQSSAAVAERETLSISTIMATPALENKVKSDGKSSELHRFTQSLDSVLIERISAARKFQIVGRSDVDFDAIKAEQDFAESGNVDSKSGAKIGKMTGAKYVLVASLDDFQDRSRTIKIDNDRQMNIRSFRVSAIAKLYNSTTGQLLEASTQTITNEVRRNINTAILSDEGANTDQMIAQASRKMADQLVKCLTDIVYPAKVVAVSSNGTITINRGEGTDIQRGQLWAVYAVGEEMIDPDTGESLGEEETLLCKAKVTSVKSKTTTLKIVGDDPGIEKGMIVRPASLDDTEED